MEPTELREKEMIANLQKTEIRFHIAKILIIIAASVITAIAVIYFIRKDNQHNLQQIKDNNAQTAENIKTAIANSNNEHSRFLCSLALQLVHSTQTIDDCVAQNQALANPKAPTPNGATSPSTPSPINTNNPTKTNASQNPTNTNSVPDNKVTNPPSQSPGAVRTLLDGFTSGTKQIINKVEDVL